MKATTKEEADAAWKQYAHDQYFGDHFKSSGTISEYSLSLINAHRSALRAKIEYEISQLTPSSDVASGKRSGLRKALDLLETTLPPKE